MTLSALATHPAHWPWPAQFLLLTAAALVCAISGLLLAVQEQQERRDHAQQRHQELRAQLRTALTQTATLATLTARKTALQVLQAQQEQQLWPASAISDGLLHTKLMRRAGECGVTLASFKPQADRPAASVMLRGSYTALLQLLEQLSVPPMPLLFDSLELQRSERPDDTDLLLNALIRVPVVPAAGATSPPLSNSKETSP